MSNGFVSVISGMVRRITVGFVFVFILVLVSSCNDMHRKQRILRKFKTTEVLFDHHDGFEIIPLFSPPEEKKEHVIALLQKANYDFPIYISIDNAWIKKSNIPKDEAFNVFLIDKEGFPIFVGDPARSGRAWESLNKIISSRSECSL